MQIGIMVALRKESVDRNTKLVFALKDQSVALRKESVDRNFPCPADDRNIQTVALRKESVDRNIKREMSLMRP